VELKRLMTKKVASILAKFGNPHPLVVNFWLRACGDRDCGGIATPSKSATVSEVAVC